MRFQNIKFEREIAFWADISMVVLESIMSLKGDTDSEQYKHLNKTVISVLQYMKTTGADENFLRDNLSVFLQTRDDFVASEISKTVSEDLTPSVLIAMCIKNTSMDEITDKEFENLLIDTYSFLSKEYYQSVLQGSDFTHSEEGEK